MSTESQATKRQHPARRAPQSRFDVREQFFPLLHPGNWHFLGKGPHGEEANPFIPRLYGLQRLNDDAWPPVRPWTLRIDVPNYEDLKREGTQFVLPRTSLTFLYPFYRNLFFVALALFVAEVIFFMQGLLGPFIASGLAIMTIVVPIALFKQDRRLAAVVVFSSTPFAVLPLVLFLTGNLTAALLVVAAAIVIAIVVLVHLWIRYIKWWSNVWIFDTDTMTIRRNVYPTDVRNIEAEDINGVEHSIEKFVSWLPERLQVGLDIGTVTVHTESGDVIINMVPSPGEVRELIHELQISFQKALKDESKTTSDLLQEMVDSQRVTQNLLALVLMQGGVLEDVIRLAGADGMFVSDARRILQGSSGSSDGSPPQSSPARVPDEPESERTMQLDADEIRRAGDEADHEEP